MLKDQLIGTWRLLSCDAVTSDGKTAYPFGPKPTGRLIYDRAGGMTVQVMASGREPLSVFEKSRATPEEAHRALKSYEAYFGTYHVNEAAQLVIHRVEGALFPNWVGTDQRRFAELSGSRLVLRTPPMPYRDGTVTTRIVWERVV